MKRKPFLLTLNLFARMETNDLRSEFYGCATYALAWSFWPRRGTHDLKRHDGHICAQVDQGEVQGGCVGAGDGRADEGMVEKRQ